MAEIHFTDLTIRELQVWSSGYADALCDLRPQLDEAIAMCRERTTQLINAQQHLAQAEAGHWAWLDTTHRDAAHQARRSIEIQEARAAHAAQYPKGPTP